MSVDSSLLVYSTCEICLLITVLSSCRNAPYVFGIRAAGCALAAGNTTIVKSSELSPHSYLAMGRALQDAGLPPGCLNILTCPARDAAAVFTAMVEHQAVRKINFTGSSNVGRKIAQACGSNLKPCLLELGGKNSALVCSDADIQLAVREVMKGAFLNVCTPPRFHLFLLSSCKCLRAMLYNSEKLTFFFFFF